MSIDLASELDRIGMKRSALAKAAGVHRSQVTRWAKWGMPIPLERVEQVAKATGIPPHKLRPDHFAKPASKQTEAA
jgi:DNA-binding transcriptional regulator YdaS (Cro superfamily)